MERALIIFVLGWAAGWWAMGRPRTVADLMGPHVRPGSRPLPVGTDRTVTIVVPARDEEHSLPLLLDDLAADDPPVGRVVVVDDHSADATIDAAAGRPGVTVVPAPDLPAGWTGKNWACHTGSTLAPDGTIVFIDADVRLEPGVLARVVGEQQRVGGLLSVQPWHDAGGGAEQLSAVFNLLAVMGSGAGRPGDADAAFGPLLVTSTDDYRALGGHAAVHDVVVEDLAIARRFRQSGRRCRLLLGRGGVRFRMYPDGLGQLVDGWTKNFATGAGATRTTRLVAAVAWIAALGTPTFALAHGDVALPDGTALYLLGSLQLFLMLRRVGRFGPVTALAHPILVVCFLAVFVRSLWRIHVRHVVTWRGRDISVSPGR